MRLYNKHSIQSEETLKSIAILYNWSEEEIIIFHYNRSKDSDKIFIGIGDQKELFLPRHVVLDKSKLVNFKGANRFAFNP